MTKRASYYSTLSPIEKARQNAAWNKAQDDLNATPRHVLDEGNPNHPMYEQIFGYNLEEFMAKQYR